MAGFVALKEAESVGTVGECIPGFSSGDGQSVGLADCNLADDFGIEIGGFKIPGAALTPASHEEGFDEGEFEFVGGREAPE